LKSSYRLTRSRPTKIVPITGFWNDQLRSLQWSVGMLNMTVLMVSVSSWQKLRWF